MDLNNLELDIKILKKLESNNITSIKDLCNLNRKSLINLNFNTSEINLIIIKLQLKGLDLNKKRINI